jgi:hypothetical protein
MRYVALSDWLGHRDSNPLDPGALQFRARPAKTCRGCLFAAQRANICTLACQVAQMSGAPHCEEGFIYVAVKRDPRQMGLLTDTKEPPHGNP